jgi:hypothetical protein
MARGCATRAVGRSHACLASLAIALAALSACAGDGSDGPQPSATPTAARTPTTTPVATATPAATPSGAPTPFPIALDLGPGIPFDVGFGGDRFLVAFANPGEAPDVVGLRLTQDGEAIDATPFPLSDFGSDPFLSSDAGYTPGGIAFDGASFGVFLFGSGTTTAGPPGQVVGFVAVPAEGPPALPATAVDEQASFSMVQTSIRPPIAATSNGSLFLGVYQRVVTMVGSLSLSQVFGQIVTVTGSGVEAQPAGPFSGPPPVDGVVTSGSAPGVAIGGSFTLIAFVQTSVDEDSPDEVATNLQGVVLTADEATYVPLSDTEAGSQNAAVASDGTSFLIVWTATSSAEDATLNQLRAVRFTPGGSPEPAGGFLIEGGDGAKMLGDVAYADGVYLVAWVEDGVVRGARLGGSGDDADVFTIDPGPAVSVALATDGTRFLAVFDRVEGTASSDVLGTFVAAE